MRTMLMILVLTGIAAPLAAEEKKAQLAKVRLTCALTGIIDEEKDGKATYTALLNAKGIEVTLFSTASSSAVLNAGQGVKVALFGEEAAARAKVLEDKKESFQERLASMKKLRAEYQERGEEIWVAEGTLGVVGKAMHMTGSARLTDRAKIDKDLPLRGALVEGEALPGDFTIGKAKTTLAIRNGDALIHVHGKLVEGKTFVGSLRIYGHLRQGANGAIILDATKIEEVK